MAYCSQLINYAEILIKNNSDSWRFRVRYHTSDVFYTSLSGKQKKTFLTDQAAGVSRANPTFLLITYKSVCFGALCSKNKQMMTWSRDIFFTTWLHIQLYWLLLPLTLLQTNHARWFVFSSFIYARMNHSPVWYIFLSGFRFSNHILALLSTRNVLFLWE